MSIVVIPARDEQDRIATCLEALAGQSVGPDAFEVILVADACVDATEARARAAAERHSITLSILTGPGEGTGPARRLGMDAAAQRLRELGTENGLIATTDADTRPAPDWLERQLAHIEDGAQVVAGLIQLRAADAAELPDAVLNHRAQDAARRMEEVLVQDPEADHHHFAGASLGITAATYAAVGGLEATPALEDEHFAGRLAEHGVPVLRPHDVVVETAARTDGRASRGLAVDLAVSSWRERRRYRVEDFDELQRPAWISGVTVIIPTRECASTIAGVLERAVAPVLARGWVDHVVVVDANSGDDTAAIAAAAGARVIQQDAVLPDFGPAQGKGDAMWRALCLTQGDVVAFMDGDTADPVPEHLLGLLGPLFRHPEVQFVKGSFDRPLQADGALLAHEGGRVTELTARPLLNLHFPLLAGFSQPLAGEFAARRELLEQLAFPVGYGVEIATLVDALAICGLDGLAECHLGTRQNRHQALRSLSEMSFAVLAAVERRLAGGRSTTAGQYLRPWEDGGYVRVPVAERPPLASLQWACSVRDSASAAP
ncbi:MAG TPA: glucosyl-3-phosphoglycerate synthase [Solirubrobacteraceae bacterium]|nr:glucosyl-3-phosphoglycerate synthase [Solirubrobacteraceae bacterium]